MRRTLSIILALFFVVGPLAAVFGETDDARLPACCRRNGAHHCAMSDAEMARVGGTSGASAFFTAPAHCPLYPNGAVAPSSSVDALAVTHVSSYPSPVRGYLCVRQNAPAVDLRIRNFSVRGPPAPAFA